MSAIAQRRTAAAAAIMMLLAVLQYALININGVAQAHHPEIEASVECVDDETQISYVATAWIDGRDNVEVERHNNDVRVTVDGVEVGTGKFTAENGFSFEGSFDAAPYFGQTIEIVVTAVPRWGVNENFGTAGESRSTTVSVAEVCEEPQDVPVTVSVSGTCVTNEDGSDSGRLNVTISVGNGAIVTVAGQQYSESTTGIVVDADSSYPWSALAEAGYFIEGDDGGTVDIGECEETTETTQPRPRPRPTTPDVESALGDLVWFDENGNGQQDDPTVEFPINGATVTLEAANGTVLAQQVTGLDGLYLFDELEAGTYRVEVCVEGADYTATNAPGVAKTVDSDVWPLAGKTGCAKTALINLPEGVTDLTWDAGLVLEVRGIQVEPTTTTAPPTTTIEPVTVETLPFTGFEVEDMALLGIGVLAAGSVLLLLMGRRDDETEGEVVSGWSNN